MKKSIEFFLNKISNWYFIGIGGCGMSSLAEILKLLNHNIYGSDILKNDTIERLKNIGISINCNHNVENICKNIEILIISSAIKNNNPEIIRATHLNIPIYHRSELLNVLVNLHKIKIGIMGTHGKGTITGAVGLTSCTNNYIIGGILEDTNSSFRFNLNNNLIVVEIDESDGTFINYNLDMILINNLSYDHMDYYKTLENLINKITNFILNNLKIKTIFLNISDLGTYQLYKNLKYSNKKIITYGKSNANYIYKIKNIKDPTIRNSCSVFTVNNDIYETKLLGEFNISNLTGAISIIKEINKKININTYNGLSNRCTIINTFDNICCVKIYAHHPLEFKLVTNTFLKSKNKTIVIYEPYGSNIFMSHIFNEFEDCFKNVDEVIITPYYLNSSEYNTQTIFDKIKNNNKIILEGNQNIYKYLITNYTDNTSLLFFGVPDKVKNTNVLDIADDIIKYYTLNNINNIYSDSRSVQPRSLFAAIKGSTFDGNNFIEDAIDNGCNSILSEKNLILPNHIMLIKSNNILKDLSDISSKFYKNFTTKIIGITGTNGKTSSCIILKSLLEQLGNKVIYIGTLGIIYQGENIDTHMTTPDSLSIFKILNKYKDADYCVMEISSHALELYRVNNLNFEVVALTNITSDHLDFHKTTEKYINAKLKIFELFSNHKLINYQYLSYLKKSYSHIKSFGEESSDYIFQNYIQNKNSLRFDFIIKSDKDKHFRIEAPYLGKFFVENICTALSILNILNYNIDYFEYPKIPGRMEIVNKNPLIIIDFSHTPDSLKKALINIKNISKKYNLIVVFGCGGDRDKKKRSIMGKIANELADYTIVTSDNPRTEDPESICQEISDIYIIDRKNAILKSLEVANDNSIILISGKGHEDYQIKEKQKFRFSDKIIVKTFTQYFNKNILIAGDGVSGISAFKLLKKISSNIKFYTDNNIKSNELIYNSDIIITSPGFSPNHLIYNNNKIKISEFELGYKFHEDSNWIAITGTNGKTTTVSLLGMIYKYVVGNIGIPTSSLPEYIEYNETIVSEVSSAQLLINNNFKPKYAAILNLSPNHINYHGSFDKYKEAKFNIFKNQNEDDYLLLPYTEWAKSIKCNSIKIYFGINIIDNCSFIENNEVFLKLNNKLVNIFNIKYTKLIGNHNLLNILVAGTIAYLDGKTKKQIEYMIENFIPIEHRLEHFKTLNGIKFINDSKSTTAISTIAALDAITDDLILLVGGISKNAKPYNIIFNYIIKNKIKNIKYVICFGESKEEAIEVANILMFKNLITVKNLKMAVNKSLELIKKNQTILLSPACSSFDQFKNYQERGHTFKNVVDKLTTNSNILK